MSYKIVFLDIDGTILPPDHKIASSTKSAVAQLKAKGIEVCMATGRPIIDTLAVAKELNVDSYITFNGAFATVKGKDIKKELLRDEDVEHLLAIAKENNHDILFASKDKNVIIPAENSTKAVEYVQHLQMHGTLYQEKSDIAEVLSGTLLLPSHEEVNFYNAITSIKLVPCNIGKHVAYDFISPSINKATAIASVIKYLNIDQSDTIAFGDGMNDKEMLTYVETGIAMGNAHQDLHPYANFVTTSVTEDGIYHGLKLLGLAE